MYYRDAKIPKCPAAQPVAQNASLVPWVVLHLGARINHGAPIEVGTAGTTVPPGARALGGKIEHGTT